MTLEVRQSNTAALTLYKKLGFEVLGTRKNYYTKPEEDAFVLGLVLDQ
jgi:ribosomal-protein-alanine N-acetyltransferase